MGRNIEAGCGIAEILLIVGCGIKMFRQERDLPILTGGMRIVVKLTAGCGMKIRKLQVTNVTQKTASITRWDRDKHFESVGRDGGM